MYNSATGEWFYTGGLNRKVRNNQFALSCFNTFKKSLLFITTFSYCLVFWLAWLVDFKPRHFYDFVELIIYPLISGFILAGVITMIQFLFGSDPEYKYYEKLDSIFESTFLSELDEIAKQFSKH